MANPPRCLPCLEYSELQGPTCKWGKKKKKINKSPNLLPRLLALPMPACNPVARSTAPFTRMPWHHQQQGAGTLSVASYHANSSSTRFACCWCGRGEPKPGTQSPKKVRRQENSCPGARSLAQPQDPTPRRGGSGEQKRRFMVLTPTCQLLSVRKHRDSGRIILRLPPQTGAELRETDDSVMPATNAPAHAKPVGKARLVYRGNPAQGLRSKTLRFEVGEVAELRAPGTRSRGAQRQDASGRRPQPGWRKPVPGMGCTGPGWGGCAGEGFSAVSSKTPLNPGLETFCFL